MMKLVFFFLILPFVFLSCSEEDADTAKVDISIELDPPVVILSDLTRYYVIGEEVIEYEIVAPWLPLAFTLKNTSDYAVTIVSASFVITDPQTGKTKTIVVDNFDPDTGETRTFFTTIRAEKDTDCDGKVEASEGPAPTPPTSGSGSGCLLDDNNIFIQGVLVYLHSIIDREEDDNGGSRPPLGDEYRGSAFLVEARFEGWFGPPQEPIKNFYKTFNFTGQAN